MKKIFVCCIVLLFGCSDNYFSSDERSDLAQKPVSTNALNGSITRPTRINITDWLTTHPKVASSIKWQIATGSDPAFPFYGIQEVDKLPWPSWSNAEKLELEQAVTDAYNWYFLNYASGQDVIPVIQDNSADVSPTQAAICYISPTDAHNLFIRWIAHSLFIEVYHIFKWSVTTYDAESLALLFDSSRFMKRGGGFFLLGFDNIIYQPNRRDLIGATVISAPIYTFKFLRNNGIVYGDGAYQYKQSVIENLIKWASANMVHYYGNESVSNAETFWGRQFVPFSKGS